jgi:hypothetical protein
MSASTVGAETVPEPLGDLLGLSTALWCARR